MSAALTLIRVFLEKPEGKLVLPLATEQRESPPKGATASRERCILFKSHIYTCGKKLNLKPHPRVHSNWDNEVTSTNRSIVGWVVRRFIIKAEKELKVTSGDI